MVRAIQVESVSVPAADQVPHQEFLLLARAVRESLADGAGEEKVEELVTAVDRFLRVT